MAASAHPLIVVPQHLRAGAWLSVCDGDHRDLVKLWQTGKAMFEALESRL